MIKTLPTRRPRTSKSEEGYILVAVIFMLAILILTMAIAAPKVAKSIQRDRDLETMHRGKQFIRALKLYHKDFGAYPPNMDAIVKLTNGKRYLRKKYIDPTTGKDEWKPIMFGMNKTVPLGFFGQPIAGSTVAGTGPGATGTGGLFGSSSTPTDATTTASTDPNATGSTTSGTSSTSSTTGQTFGGAGIIGVSPGSSKQSILVWRKKKHYNEWEFTYDPNADLVTISSSSISPTASTIPTTSPTPTTPTPTPSQ